jgi:hypothetical protein
MSERNRYQVLILTIFRNHHKKGVTDFEFPRTEIETVAKELDIVLPKNLGDLIYSFRYRQALPDEILETEWAGKEWLIEPAGRALYRFRLAKVSRIVPNERLAVIKVPDATPEIISAWALTDEQSLLAKVRYNRLIDVFLGITTYSLQNHLRTSVKGMGQIEIDEVYIGVNRNGQQFVVPVQTGQDVACCSEKFPRLTCRPVSAQFMADGVIAMFELMVEDGEISICEERHYRFVPSDQIGTEDLKRYASR